MDLFSSLRGVLRGDATAGLTDLDGPIASPYVCCRDGADLACGRDLVAQAVFGPLGPGRMRGVATKAERLLVTRLRRNRMVRPDLNKILLALGEHGEVEGDKVTGRHSKCRSFSTRYAGRHFLAGSRRCLGG